MIENPNAPLRESMGASYARVINDIIAQRIRIVALLGAVLHLCAGYLDVVSYPSLVPVFFKIRIVTCLILAIVIACTFHTKFRKHIIWFGDIALLSAACGMILMISLSDGARSDYYEGVNLVIAAGLLLNSFYVWHNLFVVAIYLLAYTAACLGHPETWSVRNYFYGVFFMTCHATWVVVMSMMYRTQHYQAFVNNMKLEDLFHRADMLSKMDSLTQVCNRRYFMEILAKQFEKAKQSNRDFYLVFFDIDHFKAINDTYGHAFGDSAIQAVVQRVRQSIRTNNTLGRYGGDEFVFFMDHLDDDRFLMRLQGIKQAIAGIEIKFEERMVPISVSLGAVKVSPEKYLDIEEVLEKADQAMLEVKKSGRGEINFIR